MEWLKTDVANVRQHDGLRISSQNLYEQVFLGVLHQFSLRVVQHDPSSLLQGFALHPHCSMLANNGIVTHRPRVIENLVRVPLGILCRCIARGQCS